MTDYAYHFWPITGLIAALLLIVIMVIVLAYRQIKALKTDRIAPEEGAVLESRMEIQDSSAEFISAELHDNIGQKLTLAKLLLTTLPSDPGRATEQVQSSIDVLTDAITDVRDLSSGLRNDVLRNHGFLKATEAEIEKLKKAGSYEIEFSVVGEPVFLLENCELVLFRVVQEVLHNIMKHASASKIEMILAYESNHLEVNIVDNGIGFDTTNPNIQGSGLKNINKRIRLLTGKAAVNSSPGNGTQVLIKLPYHERNQKL